MAPQSYPIQGIVYDNLQHPIEGAVVYLINITTQEKLSSEHYSTTNSLGEYDLNMYDLANYSDGDSYEVIVNKDGYEEKRVTGVVDMDGGGDINVYIYINTSNSSLNYSARDQVRQINLKGVLSRHKNSFSVWANNKAGNTALVVVSNGGGRGRGYTSSGKPVINLNVGEVAYVEQITYMVRTASKVCAFEVVKCSDADGAGTATAVSGQLYKANGTITETKPMVVKFVNPIRIEYDSSTAKSIAIKVYATDTSTYVDFMLEGYVLNE